jgi:hypothetical protein
MKTSILCYAFTFVTASQGTLISNTSPSILCYAFTFVTASQKIENNISFNTPLNKNEQCLTIDHVKMSGTEEYICGLCKSCGRGISGHTKLCDTCQRFFKDYRKKYMFLLNDKEKKSSKALHRINYCCEMCCNIVPREHVATRTKSCFSCYFGFPVDKKVDEKVSTMKRLIYLMRASEKTINLSAYDEVFQTSVTNCFTELFLKCDKKDDNRIVTMAAFYSDKSFLTDKQLVFDLDNYTPDEAIIYRFPFCHVETCCLLKCHHRHHHFVMIRRSEAEDFIESLDSITGNIHERFVKKPVLIENYNRYVQKKYSNHLTTASFPTFTSSIEMWHPHHDTVTDNRTEKRDNINHLLKPVNTISKETRRVPSMISASVDNFMGIVNERTPIQNFISDSTTKTLLTSTWPQFIPTEDLLSLLDTRENLEKKEEISQCVIETHVNESVKDFLSASKKLGDILSTTRTIPDTIVNEIQQEYDRLFTIINLKPFSSDHSPSIETNSQVKKPLPGSIGEAILLERSLSQ